MIRLLFVCSGNICRSPLAHRMFEHLSTKRGVQENFFVESVGTGAWHIGENVDPRMQKTAKNHGWNLDHPARQLSMKDFSTYDLILGMDAGHMATMKSRAPAGSKAKLILFRDFDPEGRGDVPDPYYDGNEGFEHVYKIIERTCEKLLDHLLAEHG